MRPRSRRVLAQRKFAQNAYVPPSTAPAPPANGDRRDNNPEERGNIIVRHQVGPTELVDFISHQALESHHHTNLQPRVIIPRLDDLILKSTTIRIKTRRSELTRNRELARSREVDRHTHNDRTGETNRRERETTNTETTNNNTGRNKESNKNKSVTFSKDIIKNKNNSRPSDGVTTYVVRKDLNTDKEVKKKDAKTRPIDKNKKSHAPQEKPKPEKPLLSQKSKATKPVHVMSLRSKRQSKHEFKKKNAVSRVTTRLAAAKRHIASVLQGPSKSGKKSNDVAKSSMRTYTPQPSSEFSLEDNRPLTYFAKNSTPKRVPATSPATRVAIVTPYNAAAEPEAGPSGISKKKNKTRSSKTKSNPYVLIPNITPRPVSDAVAGTEKQPDTNSAAKAFYSEPNIYRWMNSSLDDEQKSKPSKSKPKRWSSVEFSCPALLWHTVKELNNAEKAQLESRCFNCKSCSRIAKLMRISATLLSHKFVVSDDGDQTPDPNKQDDNVSTDGTIYMEMLPKMPSSMMKIRTHNVHGKKLLSTSMIPRSEARQTTDISLEEQEVLLDRLNETLTASAQAAESSGRVVMESDWETDCSADDPPPKRNFNTKRQRRQSVCAELVTKERPKRQQRKSQRAELISQESPRRQRRESVGPEKATEEQPKRQRRRSACADKVTEEQPKRQRRRSACAEKSLEQQPKRPRRGSTCAEKALEEQPKRSRRGSTCAEKALEEQPKRSRRGSTCAEKALEEQQKRPRRGSTCAEKALEEQQKRPRRGSTCAEKALEEQPKRSRRGSTCAEKAPEEQQKRPRRGSTCAEKALEEQPKRLRRGSTSYTEKATDRLPKRQRRDSVYHDVAIQDETTLEKDNSMSIKQSTAGLPRRQRRYSVYPDVATRDEANIEEDNSMSVKQSTAGVPRRKRRDSVYPDVATRDGANLEEDNSMSVKKSMAGVPRKRRDSVYPDVATRDEANLEKDNSMSVKQSMAGVPRKQRRDSVYPDEAAQDEASLEEDNETSVKQATAGQPRRQRRDSVYPDEATRDEASLEEDNSMSVKESTSGVPRKQRRDSVYPDEAAQDEASLDEDNSMSIKQPMAGVPRKQRRDSVYPDEAAQDEASLEEDNSMSVKQSTAGVPTKQRRDSVYPDEAAQDEASLDEDNSMSVKQSMAGVPRKQRRDSVYPDEAAQDEASLDEDNSMSIKQSMAGVPRKQRRDSVYPDEAAQDEASLEEDNSMSVKQSTAGVPTKQQRDSVYPDEAAQDEASLEEDNSTSVKQATAGLPRRQRRDSVYPDEATRDEASLEEDNSLSVKQSTSGVPRKQRRDSVYPDEAAQDEASLEEDNSTSVKQATAGLPRRQRCDLVYPDETAQDEASLEEDNSTSVKQAMAGVPRKQRRDSVYADEAAQDEASLEEDNSTSVKQATAGLPRKQRCDSVYPDEAAQDEASLDEDNSMSVKLSMAGVPRKQRRDSVYPDEAAQDEASLEEDNETSVKQATAGQPRRQRCDSVYPDEATRDEASLEEDNSMSVKESTSGVPRKQRGDSVYPDEAAQDEASLDEDNSMSIKQSMAGVPRKQRRDSVYPDEAAQDEAGLEEDNSMSVKQSTAGVPTKQRRDSVYPDEAAQDEASLDEDNSMSVKQSMAGVPRKQRRDSVYPDEAAQDEASLEEDNSISVKQSTAGVPTKQRRDSVYPDEAAQDEASLEEDNSTSVKQATAGLPRRQRRDSVYPDEATRDEASLEEDNSLSVKQSTSGVPRKQRRDSVYPDEAAQDEASLDEDNSTSVKQAMAGLPRWQWCDSVYPDEAAQDEASLDEDNSMNVPKRDECNTGSEEMLMTEQLAQQSFESENSSEVEDVKVKIDDPDEISVSPERVQMTTQTTQSDQNETLLREKPEATSGEEHNQQVEAEVGQSIKEEQTEDEATIRRDIYNLLRKMPPPKLARIPLHAVFRPPDGFSPALVFGPPEIPEDSLRPTETIKPEETDTSREPVATPTSSPSNFTLRFDDTPDPTSSEAEARLMAEVDAQAKALEKEQDAKDNGSNDQDKGHSSSTDPHATSGFPSSADSAQIVEAPVFRPTKEEFDDPLEYFEKILSIAFKYGICKVIPPEGWKPKCKINEEIRFDVSNQYISRLYCRWGPASRELSALKLCLQLQNVNVTRPPLVDGVEVNLPKLYHLVQRHGGLENVINKKRWGKVAEEMKLNKTAAIERKLDHIYVKYLLPYATLDHQERQEIMKKVEVAWSHKNQKLHDRALNPLHRQKQLLGESESSDGETEDEGTADALADAEDCVVSGQCMNFSKFKKVATNAYETYIGPERPGAESPSVESIEDRYWRIVVMGTEHLCVNTAAIDTGEEGHGFTKNRNEAYGRHPWNLKMFSQNRNNMLWYLGPVLGMTVPTLHLAMVFSTSCWHKDPHALPWTEYMHRGKERIWYGIPDDQSDNFRKAVETLAPTSCQNKSLWLPTDIAMIPPQILREHNVSLARTVQNPGEFVIVFPKAYSCSISTGYTESESVYFAPRSWVQYLAQVIQETRESCEPTMFSLEELLILMCQDQKTDIEVLKIVKPTLEKIIDDELSYRRQLAAKGLKFTDEDHATPSTSKGKGRRPATPYNVRDQDECEYCRATIYLSKVRGLTERRSSVCLEHALLLLNSSKYKDVNLEELEVLIYVKDKQLREVVESVNSRVRDTPSSSSSESDNECSFP
ncbi:microtubule-associated protein futsch [Trichoplusia ni]|uniref:Microtubule-associated protein futsch n=1 Tax=Trichoplusia ni TaxID=7111 RepID=A0A7E5WNY3_TRINI|nr:microtubule-associated protein futsch [Trichoplusia ni]